MIQLENVNFTYNNSDKGALKDVSITIGSGECVLLCGESGCGKTTITRMLNGLIPHFYEGEMHGKVTVCGMDVQKEEIYNISQKVGSVFQNPRSQFFCMDTTSEIAFGCENLGLPEKEIRERMNVVADQLEMDLLLDRDIFQLSGGEKQRVVLARQLAKQPMMFLADEPTGTLDPQTAEKLHNTLIEGVKDKGITMLITSHWPEIMNDLADHVIWLENGEIKEEGEPEGVVNHFLETVPVPEKVENPEIGAPEVQMDDVKKHYYSIERGVVKAVDGIDLTINKEEIFGIVGLSGAGKTTLTKMLIGLTEPSSGKIEVKLGEEWVDMSKSGPLNRGRVIPYMGLLHQEYSLYPHRTILGNLTDAISLELPAEFAKIKAIHVLTTVGFDENIAEGLLNKYPDELSVGEKHRVALAQVLIKEPKIIILDEPTGTMDPITRVIVTDSILKARKELEQTFIIISHDMDFVLDVCDRSALMRGGKILDVGTPDEIVKQLTADEKEGMFKN